MTHPTKIDIPQEKREALIALLQASLTAGIDLSVGAIMVMSSVVMGQFTFRYGLPPSVSIVCGLAVGTAIGALNGWLVSRVKLPPFIVTLGAWGALRGMAKPRISLSF